MTFNENELGDVAQVVLAYNRHWPAQPQDRTVRFVVDYMKEFAQQWLSGADSNASTAGFAMCRYRNHKGDSQIVCTVRASMILSSARYNSTETRDAS